jgi:hypothetical protein
MPLWTDLQLKVKIFRNVWRAAYPVNHQQHAEDTTTSYGEQAAKYRHTHRIPVERRLCSYL